MAEEVQHQALYRRYRPQTPSDVIGQDHVIRALTGAIREGRLHHAFLFCGPRGTGKTSTARILAKMVDCEQGPTAEPCGTCAQCVAIREGTHLDVIEIDAASHGGVEDARELREKAPTAPVQGREKVYIIDEAQRLSREAFDALLKVFEEPPPGVRFVLATTEPHKMPPTIVGRCQRFDFRRLTLEDLAAHLQRVGEAEGVPVTDSAAHAIARHAEGSARDALSLLDQAGVLGGETVDDDAVQALLGAPRGEVQTELADAVAVGDAKGAFEVVDRLVQDGQDLRNVTNETLAHFRNLLLITSAPGQRDLVDVPADAYDALRVQAEKFTSAELTRVLDLLLEAQSAMRWTTSPRLSLELALTRATYPQTHLDATGLVSRLERLERLAGLEAGTGLIDTAAPRAGKVTGGSDAVAPSTAVAEPTPSLSTPATETTSTAKPPPPQPPTTPSPEPTETRDDAPHAATTGGVDVAMLRRSWPSLMEYLASHREPLLQASLESATVSSFDGQTLEIAFPPQLARKGPQNVERKQDALREALQAVFGVRPIVTSVTRESIEPVDEGPAAAAVEIVEEEEVPDETEALRRAQELLGGSARGSDV
jgi:DNA polymerase-3 subunit gamma/tau